MKLFNRNNETKTEISNLKEDVSDLKEVFDKSGKEFQSYIDEMDKLSEKVSAIDKNYVEFNEVVNNKLEELERKLSLVQAENNELHKENQDLKDKTKKVYEIVKQSLQNQVEIEKAKENDNHLFQFGDYFKMPYSEITLNGKYLSSTNGHFSFDILDVIEIKAHLQEYYEQDLSISAIASKHSMSPNVISGVIWNIEEGNFDNLIEEYTNGVPEVQVEVPEEDEKAVEYEFVETTDHIRKVARSFRKPINVDILKIGEDGRLYSNNRRLKYTIQDVVELKKNIPNIEDYPTVASLLEDVEIGELGGAMLIWRIEEGFFDDLIREYEEEHRKYHIFPLGKSYQQRLGLQVRLGDEGELYNSNNRRLSYTIQDIIDLKKRIYSGKYNTVGDIYDRVHNNIPSKQLCLKLIWNIEEGNFDKLIEEYTSRKYTYENKQNILYVDGENTGLTIEKCNLIVDCVINDPDRSACVNRLIRNYSTTKPKFIRILAEEYNNVNLSRVLEKEVKKVERIDNPQKRREMGVYL